MCFRAWCREQFLIWELSSQIWWWWTQQWRIIWTWVSLSLRFFFAKAQKHDIHKHRHAQSNKEESIVSLCVHLLWWTSCMFFRLKSVAFEWFLSWRVWESVMCLNDVSHESVFCTSQGGLINFEKRRKVRVNKPNTFLIIPDALSLSSLS